ncbi:MAG: hypothetical protein U0441_25570 [Polyangiaceae bacterium]
MASFAESFSMADLSRLLRGLTGGSASAQRAFDLALGIARGRVLFRGATIGRRVYVGAGTRVVDDGEIRIGDSVCLFGGMLGSELIAHAGAALVIGSGCQINYGTSIEAHRRIEIADGCRVGSMVRIADAGRGAAEPVRIGAGVWIAHGCVIEPGVTIGAGSVVSAGSVVTTSIPEGSLAVGNPARAVRLEIVARPLSQEVPS